MRFNIFLMLILYTTSLYSNDGPARIQGVLGDSLIIFDPTFRGEMQSRQFYMKLHDGAAGNLRQIPHIQRNHFHNENKVRTISTKEIGLTFRLETDQVSIESKNNKSYWFVIYDGKRLVKRSSIGLRQSNRTSIFDKNVFLDTFITVDQKYLIIRLWYSYRFSGGGEDQTSFYVLRNRWGLTAKATTPYKTDTLTVKTPPIY